LFGVFQFYCVNRCLMLYLILEIKENGSNQWKKLGSL
jgi:hypothetical protein